MVKLKVIIPAVIILCTAVWWLMPHFSDQDKAYYVSLYCLQPTGSDQQIQARMQQTIENNNQDYALKKRHFSPMLGKHIQDAWDRLTPDQQQQAQQRDNCTRLLLEKLNIPAP
ncbi:hypothetical protein HH682_08885 [Rosenbergiella sp. S61]|uniref:Uncharacterized protein n=1 Tax=Rosenbergiella gaditana TaxID=2726987 RepID=A0ABS5SZ90_9GAMM|nr:hypothetical protein [Rosenbergiella gaditana]MBT0724545.1 hypothetical protein [Rosenbergiella gaditana]